MLSILMANICGPTEAKQKFIMAAANSILLYGNKIWGDALEIESKRKTLAAVRRTAAQRVASAYRTVTSGAFVMIVGEIPIDLLAFERRRS